MAHDGRTGGRDLVMLGALGVAVVAIVAIHAFLLVPGHLLAAQLVSAALVLLLVNAGPLRPVPAQTPAAAAVTAALRALALVPTILVVALALPSRDWTQPVAILGVALPVGFAALRLAPYVGLSLRRLFAFQPLVPMLWAALAGAALSLLAYSAGAPALWSDGATGDAILAALVAAVVAAGTEEFVFRGLVQGTLQRAAGRTGIVAAVAVFASTYLDAGSAALVLTFALAGAVFALATVASSGAITGAIVGHIVLVLGAGAVWPQTVSTSELPELPEPATAIVLAAALLVTTALVYWLPARARELGDS